jgi:hypothetical protein
MSTGMTSAQQPEEDISEESPGEPVPDTTSDDDTVIDITSDDPTPEIFPTDVAE